MQRSPLSLFRTKTPPKAHYPATPALYPPRCIVYVGSSKVSATHHHLPELRAPVELLIERVRTIHQGGGGSLPVLMLLEGFGVRLRGDEQPSLEARGQLTLTPESDAAGRFENDGPAVTMPRKRITLRLPERISGTYRLNGDETALRFDEDQTLSLSFLVFRLRLKEVVATPTEVILDVGHRPLLQHIRL